MRRAASALASGTKQEKAGEGTTRERGGSQRSVAAGASLAVLFVAMLPANIHAAREGLMLGGKPVTRLARRIPEQVLYIGLAVGAAIVEKRRRRRDARDDGVLR